MRDWPEWLEFWKAALVAMEAPPPPIFATFPHRAEIVAGLARIESDGRAETDRACASFAEFGVWPPMAPTVHWLAMLRVAHALEFSLLLLMPHRGEPAVVAAPQMDTRRMMEWFLTDSWPAGCSVSLARLADADFSRAHRRGAPQAN